jgi:TRAP-type C4-dicarboxylate transport system permease small subunit
MKAIAKGVCDAIEVVGIDCDWRATQAVLIAIPAILLVLLLTWLGTRKPFFRKALDGLYTLGGIISAIFLLIMLGIICAQMVARWSGIAFPGSTSYAGYCMAASSFFGLAYALNAGAHIRVNLMLTALGRHRVWGEIWCFGIAAYLATYFARYAIKGTMESVRWNDISQGQDATPLWIPQVAMCIGTVLLAIAVWDNFFRILFVGTSNIVAETVADDTPPPAAEA